MQLAFLNATWRPDDFWQAAPVEVLALAAKPANPPLTRDQFNELRALFPDEPS